MSRMREQGKIAPEAKMLDKEKKRGRRARSLVKCYLVIRMTKAEQNGHSGENN